MKKLVVISTLVGVLAFSMPVMAASPTAPAALTPATQTTAAAAATNLTAEQQTAVASTASSLLTGGVIKTQAAANAVATSLVNIQSAPEVTEKALDAETTAIYNSYSAQQKAVVDKAATTRNISVQEVIGNYIKADATNPNSKKVAWNPNLSKSSVDGKAGDINVVLSRPSAAVSADAANQAKNISATAQLLNTVTLGVQGNSTFKTLDTALSVDGISATDTPANFRVRALVNGKWVDVKVTGVAKGTLALQLTGNYPIAIYRV